MFWHAGNDLAIDMKVLVNFCLSMRRDLRGNFGRCLLNDAVGSDVVSGSGSIIFSPSASQEESSANSGISSEGINGVTLSSGLCGVPGATWLWANRRGSSVVCRSSNSRDAG